MYQNKTDFFSPHFKINKTHYLFWLLKQSQKHYLNFIIVPHSSENIAILRLLHQYGYIAGFQSSGTALKIFLKWSLNGEASFQKIKTFSKPSWPHTLRYNSFLSVYIKSNAITPLWLFKTNLGYLDQYGLLKKKLGGTLLLVIS